MRAWPTLVEDILREMALVTAAKGLVVSSSSSSAASALEEKVEGTLRSEACLVSLRDFRFSVREARYSSPTVVADLFPFID